MRLHPDKVDDEVAKYCGGHDRVKQAYHFMDEAAWMIPDVCFARSPQNRKSKAPSFLKAYKAAKQWLDEKEHNRLPPWERWFKQA